MAKKKNLTIDQKITIYKRKKRLFTVLKIAIAAVVVALLIPVANYGYYYYTFTYLPERSSDPNKINGVGYCKPLRMINSDDPKTNYVLAYYYDGCWSVVEDSQKLRENRYNFIIYKEDDEWHDGTHLQLIVIKDKIMVDSIPLSEKTLIDDRCFRDCTIKMTMEEFKNYLSEKGFDTVYIK